MAYVYFARCGQYVKIGFSSWPEHRVKNLLNGSVHLPADLDRSQPVELIQVIGDCISRDERDLHKMFAEFRVEGEWFRASEVFMHRVMTLDYTTVRVQRLERRRQRMIERGTYQEPRGSGWPDSNRRPSDPQSDALPSCATARGPARAGRDAP